MRVPISWLKEHVQSSSKPEHIAHTLTMLGLEVDEIAYGDLGFSSVVVVKVTKVEKHPSADNLVVATLFDGTKEYQVVTSAPNCKAGMKSAYGKVGAKLPNDVILKARKLQGVQSEGALLSHEELGLAAKPYGVTGGIMEFAQHIKEGEEVKALFAEPILEISLTPNLAHAASIRGTARELTAAEKSALLPYPIAIKEEGEKSSITLKVEDQKDCPRYCCRIIHDVTVGPSPAWLQERIEAAGMRSVNGVVDITNYVMLEMGQPLHAFDLAKIEGKTLSVRRGKANEKITTLDGNEHVVTKDMLVVADSKKPLALAGVMGSEESEVSEETTSILLESAYFSPNCVRYTSKVTGIQSGASYRFERGADRGAIVEGLHRAAELIQKHCQGKVAKGVIASNDEQFMLPEVSLRLQRVSTLLGVSLGKSEIVEILERLHLTITKESDEALTVQPPSYRHDIKEEIDLIEEVARLYGYHNLKSAKSHMWQRAELASSPAYLFEKKVRELLLRCNVSEVVTTDLISPKQAELVPSDVMAKRSLISLLNPSSVDHSVLRPSLLPGLLSTLTFNVDHGIDSAALFEVGRTHFSDKERYIEPSMAGLLLSGKASPLYWQEKERLVDFYDLKGIVEALLTRLDVKEIVFTRANFSNLHPKRQAHIVSGSTHLGVIGEVHPSFLKKIGCKQPCFFAEINLDDIRAKADGYKQMKPRASYPASVRDWTLPITKEIEMHTIFSLIKKASSPLLESVVLIDIYEKEDRVHATFRFSYREQKQTISHEAVEKEHGTITQSVLAALNKG